MKDYDIYEGRPDFQATIQPVLVPREASPTAFAFSLSPSIQLEDPAGFGDIIYREMQRSEDFAFPVTPIVGPTIGALTIGRIIRGRNPRLGDSEPRYFVDDYEMVNKSLAYALWSLVGQKSLLLKFDDTPTKATSNAISVLDPTPQTLR